LSSESGTIFNRFLGGNIALEYPHSKVTKLQYCGGGHILLEFLITDILAGPIYCISVTYKGFIFPEKQRSTEDLLLLAVDDTWLGLWAKVYLEHC